MAHKIMVGANGTAHDVNDMYVGVNGTARKVVRGYVGGPDGKAHLIYGKDFVWYLCSGLEESDVIAAYKFAGAENETAALTNVNNGTKYTLTKSSNNISWNSSTGFTFPAEKYVRLSNSTLNGLWSSVRTIIFKFSDASTTSSNMTIGGSYLYIRRFLTIRGTGGGTSTHYNNLPAMSRSGVNDSAMKCAPQRYASGVIGGNFADTGPETVMYINGVLQTLTNADGNNNPTDHPEVYADSIRGLLVQPRSTTIGSYKVQSIVLYNKLLTATEHLAIANNMTR